MDVINWRKWSEHAFDESRGTGKPVLLDISAVWCHWCHVMDRTTYSDPRVIEMINEEFIPVRVDNDREPDINERYNMGGWPTTAFLTQDGDVITGGTYIPPVQMLDLLRKVVSAYSENKDDLTARAAGIRAQTEGMAAAKPTRAALDNVDRVLTAIESYYDREHGGFGWGQKFPLIPVMEFLTYSYERTGRQDYLDMVTHTLDAMLGGEVFDPVEGGMFRYATLRDWRVPHYEKMLGDNAGIAAVLVNAHRLTGDEKYLQAARGIFDYLDNVLLDPKTGAYFGSQDADEEYYAADQAGRQSMAAPRVDPAVYTDTNARTAFAWFTLWSVTGLREARDKALRVVDFFNGLPRARDGTVAHYFEDGEPRGHGYLSDHVWLLLANTIAFEATGDSAYLDAALNVLKPLVSEFKAPSGGYHDISAARAESRGLQRKHTPISENATLAMVLIALADLAENPGYRWQAGQILDSISRDFEQHGIMASEYAMAVSLANCRPVLVNVSGADGGEESDRLIRASLATCGLRCTVKPDRASTSERASASICVGTSCCAQTSDPDQLAEELSEVLSSSRA